MGGCRPGRWGEGLVGGCALFALSKKSLSEEGASGNGNIWVKGLGLTVPS